MRTSRGKTAAAVAASPDKAVRGSVVLCIAQLRIAADLAEVAVDGPSPEDGAEHVVGVFDDLAPELAFLRAAVRKSYRTQ